MDENLKDDLKWSAGGTTTGATCGYLIGSTMGIAAFGTAVAGTWPLAVTAGVVGGLGTYACRDISRRLMNGKRRGRH